MTLSLAALALWGGTVARAQETPRTLPSSDAPPAETPAAETPPAEVPGSMDLDIAQFLGESDASTLSAPPPPAPTAPNNPNAFNPRITAFGDILTSVGIDKAGVMPGSGPWVRSFEMDIRADVDPFAKAVAVVAVGQEPPPLAGGVDPEGGFSIAPEELYLDLVSLPAGISARVGQFKLPFGLTNRMHPHDWPWPDAPMPFVNTLGSEGMAETAATASWRIPNPWGVAFTLEGGVTGGNALDWMNTSPVPGFIGRAEYFQDLGQFELGLGASTVGQTDKRVDGADMMLRWRKDSWHSVVLMGEAFRNVEAGTGGPVGITSTLQVQPTRPLYFGARVDEMGGSWEYAGYISYYTTEFLRIRAGASTDLSSVLATGQLTFVWGSHPVEPYWVNR